MSSYANAGIIVGAIISIKDLEKFKVQTPSVTRTEKRFSQKTGKPIKDAVVTIAPAMVGYHFSDEYVAMVEDEVRYDVIADLGVAETLGEFLNDGRSDDIAVGRLDNDSDEVLFGIGIPLRGAIVDIDGSWDAMSLSSEPFTDLASLPAMVLEVHDIILARLGLDVKVGLITALDVGN